MLEYFSSFKRSAFRLEVLQEYDVSYEEKAFENFVKTGVVDQEINSQWHDILADANNRGAVVNRVRVVEKPFSDYLKFELELYKQNVLAGENIFVVDKSQLDTAIDYDFWLFDDEVVLILQYDQDGKYLGFEKKSKNIDLFIDAKNTLLEKAVKLDL